MALALVGHWKLEKNENWDEYMVAAGVNYLLRKAAENITSYEEISVEGDNNEQWHLKHTSTFRSRESHPIVGQEFEETTMDGRRVKSVLIIEGDKLVYRQKATKEGEIDTTVTRELLDDGRLLTKTMVSLHDVILCATSLCDVAAGCLLKKTDITWAFSPAATTSAAS